MAEQPSLFAPDPDAVQSKPPGTQFERMKILITVKAAPNPSATYGETVCVAGLRLDLDRPGWVRLYPINYRELDGDSRFRKYDVVNLYAKPSANDPRVESWRPRIDSFVVEKHLDGWSKRMPYIGDYIEESMCGLIADVKERPPARSLAAVRPAEILALDIEPHPGWTRAEQDKIDQYVRQLDLYDTAPRTALEAPRFKAWYRYRCRSRGCNTHRQGIFDWELVALQRSVRDRGDAATVAAIREKFWDLMCAPDRDTIFYVGNQQAHPQSFIVLGVVYPPKTAGRRPTGR
ncbi:hypothetical protein HNP84_002347 [Thermocatellispora tengchongensis]|uniref:Uncharacterized protein n=1 Tax=Thermocatellispora tengchongensis TaxID=1073253 RepID=A0A840P442_9ACTN|nr:hypothetical protein [Thermocatellispora tengchongensis]MBB5132631.1 hypothetical protein [Thermocatellispora tengchongensis]